MTVKIVTNFGELLRLAKAEAQARINGTKDEYEEAKKKHQDYKEICLQADLMTY